MEKFTQVRGVAAPLLIDNVNTDQITPVVFMRSLEPDYEKALFGPDEAKVAVVVDQASKQLLEGATLDYKDGLNQAGFSITNPNATRTCGCGSSFS